MINSKEVDAMFDVIDNMRPCAGWMPTLEDFQFHNVDDNFEKYARFLLWISEADEDLLSDEDAEKFQEVKKYINHLFKKKVLYT